MSTSPSHPPSYLPPFTEIPPFDDPFSCSLPFGILWKCYKLDLENTHLNAEILKISMAEEQSTEQSRSLAKCQQRISRIAPLCEAYAQYKGYEAERESLRALLSDPEMQEDEDFVAEMVEERGQLAGKMGEEAPALCEAAVAFYNREVQAAITADATQATKDGPQKASSDPDDEPESTDVILEVKPGTGGDEASLFALELFANYEKTCATNGWSWDVMTLDKTELGGLKEGVVGISDGGADPENGGVYTKLKFESGVHRVQRVPVNDVRIQTSAATVIVLPQPPANSKTVELLPMKELRIDIYRASGAGGQHVNTTESAVRVTHLPTGLVAAIQDERSQHKNKDKALHLIAARVFDLKRQEAEKKSAEIRGAVAGSGNRSDRIRTYNFKDDRVTDHRSKVTVFGCSKILELGQVVETFVEGLHEMTRDDVLKEMEKLANEEWEEAARDPSIAVKKVKEKKK